MVGSDSIHRLRRVSLMATIGGNFTAPEVTRWFEDQKWPRLAGWLIFTTDGMGNPIGFAQDGTVWVCDGNFGEVVQIAAGFEDYLVQWSWKSRPEE